MKNTILCKSSKKKKKCNGVIEEVVPCWSWIFFYRCEYYALCKYTYLILQYISPLFRLNVFFKLST